VFNILINYSGRAEITDAVRKLLVHQPHATQITEEALPTYLQVPDLPDVDLIIRAGGEYRTSDFLVWQSAHAIVYVTPKLWPDLDLEDIDHALRYYDLVLHHERVC
jgi:undecaprenyl diphosphate synthase